MEEDRALRGSSFRRIQFLEQPAVRESNSGSAWSWRRIRCSPHSCRPSLLAGLTHVLWPSEPPVLDSLPAAAVRPEPPRGLLPGRPIWIWVLLPTPNPISAWSGPSAAGSTGSTRMKRATAPVARPHPARTSGNIHGISWAELHGAPSCIPPVLPQLLFLNFSRVFCDFFPTFCFFMRTVRD